MTTRYLILFDADKIKDYVFATGRLKEIRGASEQVRQLTDPEPLKTLFRRCLGRPLDAWQEGVPEGLIYAGGGTGALLVANQDDAQIFCTELERTYRRTTRSATLSAICVPVEAGLEQEKRPKPWHLPPAGWRTARPVVAPQSTFRAGVIRFCDSDRRYPASDRSFSVGGRPGEPQQRSASSANKRKQTSRKENNERQRQ